MTEGGVVPGDLVRWFDRETHLEHQGRIDQVYKMVSVMDNETRYRVDLYYQEVEKLEVCNETIKIGKDTFKCESLNTRYHTHEANLPDIRVTWSKKG